MDINKKIMDIVKEQVLKEYGNPEYYYDIFCNDDGYYLCKTKIETIDIEPRLSGGYHVKINGEYKCLFDYSFDEELAKKKVFETNIEYWNGVKKRAEEDLENFDTRVAKEKAKLMMRLQLAKCELERRENLKKQEEQ